MGQRRSCSGPPVRRRSTSCATSPPTPPLMDGSWPTSGKGWVSTLREPMASNTTTTANVMAVAFQLRREPGRRTAASTASARRSLATRCRRRGSWRQFRHAAGAAAGPEARRGRPLGGAAGRAGRPARRWAGGRREPGAAAPAAALALFCGRRRGSGRHPGQLVAPFQAQTDHGPEAGAAAGLQLPQGGNRPLAAGSGCAGAPARARGGGAGSRTGRPAGPAPAFPSGGAEKPTWTRPGRKAPPPARSTARRQSRNTSRECATGAALVRPAGARAGGDGPGRKPFFSASR